MPALTSHEIIRRPIITEKSTGSIERLNAYVFEVATEANKLEIHKAVEELFGVKVKTVNTRWRRGRWRRLGRTVGRTSGHKEAIVTLMAGDKIDVF
jgi:large subunit ribosomal protein L23